MVTVRVKKKIKDAVANKIYSANEEIKYANSRFKEIQAKLGKDFDKYFEIIAIDKTTKDVKAKKK